MEKLISVIVPCYKVEEYLSECIESIINQSYRNLEIILVDDGSPDRSGQICEQYKAIDNRIIVIHQENMGLSGARNTGIEKASGEYLFFVDSDDYILPNAILILYMKAISSGAEIVSCLNTNSKNIVFSGEKWIEGSGSEVLDYILQKASWSAWGKLFKKEIIGEDRFPQGFIYEDFEFVPRQFLKARKAAHYQDVLYNYRIRNDGIMGKSNNCLRIHYFDFAEKNISCINESVREDDLKNRLIAGIYTHVIWDYCRQTKLSKSIPNGFLRSEFKKFYKENRKMIFINRYIARNYKVSYFILSQLPFLFYPIYILKQRINIKYKKRV